MHTCILYKQLHENCRCADPIMNVSSDIKKVEKVKRSSCGTEGTPKLKTYYPQHHRKEKERNKGGGEYRKYNGYLGRRDIGEGGMKKCEKEGTCLDREKVLRRIRENRMKGGECGIVKVREG